MKRLLLIALFASALCASHDSKAQAQAKPAASQAQTQSRLSDAYKREFAFLESEKRALELRLAQQKKSAQERASSAKAEISTLQGKVVHTAGQAERFEELVLAAERDAELALGQGGR